MSTPAQDGNAGTDATGEPDYSALSTHEESLARNEPFMITHWRRYNMGMQVCDYRGVQMDAVVNAWDAMRSALTQHTADLQAMRGDSERWREMIDEGFIATDEDGGVYISKPLAEDPTEISVLTERELAVLQHGGDLAGDDLGQGIIASKERIEAIWDCVHADKPPLTPTNATNG